MASEFGELEKSIDVLRKTTRSTAVISAPLEWNQIKWNEMHGIKSENS